MTHEKAITIAQLIIDNDNLKTENEQLKNDLINSEMNLQIMTDKYTQAMELMGLAVKEFHQYKFMDVCVICDNCISCSCLPWRTCNGVNFRWKHADKLEELRGGKDSGN